MTAEPSELVRKVTDIIRDGAFATWQDQSYAVIQATLEELDDYFGRDPYLENLIAKFARANGISLNGGGDG